MRENDHCNITKCFNKINTVDVVIVQNSIKNLLSQIKEQYQPKPSKKQVFQIEFSLLTKFE